MDKLYIVMPAYNEQDNIESVVRNWYKVLSFAGDESKLIVADSGSTDGTHNILTSLKSELSKLEIISNSNKFHGPKLIAMYKLALANNADFIFQTDSDGQTNPDEFKGFWDLKEDYDVIIGHRVIRGDGYIRKLIEKIVCLILKIIFNVDVKDANAPFRLMKANALGKYINRFDDDYELPNIMLTTYFSFYKHGILYKEISFKKRQGGKNSINLCKIIKVGFKAISDFKKFKREMC